MKVSGVSKADIRNIKLWYASFVLFAAVVLLAAFCFWFETLLALYCFCAFLLITWVILYTRIKSKITHKDGYLLVQAMSFYRSCNKRGLDASVMFLPQNEPVLAELLSKTDLDDKSDCKKITEMFRVGRAVFEQFGVSER